MPKIKKIIRTIFLWAWQIVLILLITLLISVFLIQTYDIEDVSMEPTFDRQGNRVVVFLTPQLLRLLPNYGDIIIIDSRVERKRTLLDRVLESPLPSLLLKERKEYMLVKRVVGLPGDTLELKNGRLYRNDQEIEEPYIKEATQGSFTALVPADHVYVMGDNRNHSKDSRQIGPVPLSNIQGRVILRFLPPGKITTY